MTSASDGYAHGRGQEWTKRLTPSAVRSTTFGKAPLTRRGYSEDEVDRFMARVAEDISAADADRAALRAEIDRLRRWYRDRGIDVDDQSVVGAPRPNVQAVNLMSQAQQAADNHIAQAEEYARRLVGQARQRYEEILREAQQQAAQAAERAAEVYRASPDAYREEEEQLERRIAYLRTFAQVTQVQLQSAFEALHREVGKLGNLPTHDEAPHSSDLAV
ncbi:MAG TPA: DivIVA domain-containing protein [Actinomycetes bacterium]|jgi:cell division initiation protein|nr:DivIVA domain-containing protein [Actinomycetes bacterium]